MTLCWDFYVSSYTYYFSAVTGHFSLQKKRQRSRLRSRVPPGVDGLRPPSRFPAIGSPATTGRSHPPLGGGFKLPSLAANT